MYSFRGGPWNGFLIEYDERVQPNASVEPDAGEPPATGCYRMNNGKTAYVWVDMKTAGPLVLDPPRLDR